MSDAWLQQLRDSLPSWQQRYQGADPKALTAYLEHYGLTSCLTAACHEIGLLPTHHGETCVQRFRCLRASRGEVVLCHGYMDHAGLYGALVKHLLAQHYDVVTFDLLGHGLSEGDPLAIAGFEHYALQLQTVIQHTTTGKRPLVLIGQSTGAAVISAQQWWLPLEDRPVAHRILLAPLVRPALWRSIRRQFHMLRHFLNQVPRRYTNNSHDAGFLRFVRQSDPLQHGDIPLSWIAAMQRWADFLEVAEPQQCPVTCVQGIADGTVDWHHNLRVISRVYPDVQVELIEGARHHLVNESDAYREPVFEHISAVLARL